VILNVVDVVECLCLPVEAAGRAANVGKVRFRSSATISSERSLMRLWRSISPAQAARAIDPYPAGPYTAASSERVAQMVEHVTFNHGVLGSIPSALTKQNQ
jgi:hypothetical protein